MKESITYLSLFFVIVLLCSDVVEKQVTQFTASIEQHLTEKTHFQNASYKQ